MTLLYIIAATILVSLFSLIGIFFLTVKEEILDELIFFLVSFAVGALIGGAFFHLIPEAFEASNLAPFYIISGIALFFLLEKFFFWRHCHKEHCDVHPFTYVNLVGDGFHNFVDGAVIAGSFLVSFELGVVTTLVIAAHEIPQELGDFAVLVYGGLSPLRALSYNLLSALLCVLGGILAYFFGSLIEGSKIFLLAFAGGGFLYLAMVDLIPEMHKKEGVMESFLQITLIILGVALMWGMKAIFG